MIVFLDTNTLMADALCAGAAWRVLALAPDSWDLRLCTSEVAIAEAVAGYRRQLSPGERLDKFEKDLDRLGARPDLAAFREALSKRAASYSDLLLAQLTAARVEVFPAPAASHIDLVTRSAARRRPFNHKGDGYRDALLWLTVVKLAHDNAGQPILFVTQDTDFMNDEKTALHPDLVHDLAGDSLEPRVRLANSLTDVVFELAERSPDDKEAIHSLRQELRDETLLAHVTSLAATVVGTTLDARACALPPATTHNLVQQVGSGSDLDYTIKGVLANEQAVAEFSFEADAQVVVTLSFGQRLVPDARTAAVTETENESVYVIWKRLVFSGLVQLGRYDRPLGGEISRVTAPPDDPARNAWRFDVTSRLTGNMLADIMQSYQVSLADAVRAFQLPDLNPVAEAMRAIQIPDLNPVAEVMRAIQIPDLNPVAEVMRAIQIPDLNPVDDIFKDANSDEDTRSPEETSDEAPPAADLHGAVPPGEDSQPDPNAHEGSDGTTSTGSDGDEHPDTPEEHERTSQS